jgi:hypothetical protein
VLAALYIFMNIPQTKIREFYWEKYKKLIALSVLLVTALVGFFLYTYSRSVTGEEIEHAAIVIGTNVTHGYGPQGQNVRAMLNSGKEVYLNFDGTPVNVGDHILVIEKLRRGGATSYYRYKPKI